MVVEGDPELVDMVARAGVRTVWLAGFFYGHRFYDDDLLRRARLRLERAGLEAQLITVPLGHPGDSLGATDGGFPLTPPEHWQTGQRPDGTVFAGTSLHPPATEENQAFRAQERAFRGDLGIMVMYLGAEKAGLRLRDYRSAWFRVGELMFHDS